MAVGIGVVCFTYSVKIAQNRPARRANSTLPGADVAFQASKEKAFKSWLSVLQARSHLRDEGQGLKALV